MTFNIITLGCKVNQYESSVMKEQMLNHHFFYNDDFRKSDIVIVNTCSVTNTADQKCLKLLRQIKRLNPTSILVVTGCSSQNNQDLFKTLDIDILLGNKNKSKIADLINEFIKTNQRYTYFCNDREIEFENMQVSSIDKQRAYIKIEDGCDNFCSYCIIPYLRGSVRSKNFLDCINEANILANAGHQEIILTGIHTGRYFSNNHDLTDLIHELSKIDKIKRIRISSIEITELNDKFLNELKTNSKICDHLHIPLQSGSDEILKKMNRKYDTKTYESIIKKIRSIRPDISITTDIIVGHPFETEENFKETIEFSKKIKFAKIHVFPYSPRKKTVASSMPNQVSDVDKKRRVNELINLSFELEEEYYLKFKGQKLDVLIEEHDINKSIGHTSNYLRVELDELLEIGQIYNRCV